MPRDGATLAPPSADQTWRVALVLVFPTIGMEQLLHTDQWALADFPLYQVLHWLSDSLLALPLAAGAVWAGQRLATRLGFDTSASAGIVGRACLIACFFALLLVPGAWLHDMMDRLTHVHAGFPIHSHILLPRSSNTGLAPVVRFAGHALSDAIKGQAIGFPLTILALIWGERKPSPDAT
jgi:hypothetical protein